MDNERAKLKEKIRKMRDINRRSKTINIEGKR